MARRNLNMERIGEERVSRYGSLMKVIDYVDFQSVWIMFENGYVTRTSWKSFSEGSVKTPYDKTVCNTGYLGEGEYKACVNCKVTPQNETWRQMIRRCYSLEFQKKHPSYINCTVSEEWHNFQNFAKWYDENYYEIDGEKTELDKDILVKGNKIYSPETCIFVPSYINLLFTKSNGTRGNLPIGVRKYEIEGRFMVQCNNKEGRKVSLGIFDSKEEAFEVYKNFKEKQIREVAEKFRAKIPYELYNAMISYKVEITD